MRSERGDQLGYDVERASSRGLPPEVAMKKSANGAFPVWQCSFEARHLSYATQRPSGESAPKMPCRTSRRGCVPLSPAIQMACLLLFRCLV